LLPLGTLELQPAVFEVVSVPVHDAIMRAPGVEIRLKFVTLLRSKPPLNSRKQARRMSKQK
jgi:hypothetical protein